MTVQAGWFKGHIGARPTTAKERNSGFRNNVVFGPKETRASQLNPEDHGRLWFQIIKHENEEQVNAAILDGMRRYNLFRGDDPPGPFAYVLAAPTSYESLYKGQKGNNGARPYSRSSRPSTSHLPGGNSTRA